VLWVLSCDKAHENTAHYGTEAGWLYITQISSKFGHYLLGGRGSVVAHWPAAHGMQGMDQQGFDSLQFPAPHRVFLFCVRQQMLLLSI